MEQTQSSPRSMGRRQLIKASDMEASRVLRARIIARIKQLGTNAKAVSVKAGLGNTAIGDILRERSKSPSIATTAAIAKAPDCDISYLIGVQDVPRLRLEHAPLEPIPIVGVAEAGSFRLASVEALSMGSVIGPRSPRYPNAKHFSRQMRGNSMNAATHNGRHAPILDGMLVLCVDVEDAKIEIETGEFYLVRRAVGETEEYSVRKAVMMRDRTEFRAESTEHHAPVIVPHRHEDGSHRIEVVGWVYAAVTDFSTP
jgi:transcriptional regulator with XRE-family HTH domain